MNKKTSSPVSSFGQMLPLLGFFAGGLVHSLLPRGAFGTYDIAIRAAITGIVAGTAMVLLYAITMRGARPSPQQNEAA